MMDGIMADCEPGDIECSGDGMIEICSESWFWESYNCDDLCREELGPDAISRGCDESAESPCLCEYDILEGEAPVCEPGDIICLDDDTRGLCGEDGWDWIAEDCYEFCVEFGGPDVVEAVCDDEAEEGCVCVAIAPSK